MYVVCVVNPISKRLQRWRVYNTLQAALGVGRNIIKTTGFYVWIEEYKEGDKLINAPN